MTAIICKIRIENFSLEKRLNDFQPESHQEVKKLLKHRLMLRSSKSRLSIERHSMFQANLFATNFWEQLTMSLLGREEV